MDNIVTVLSPASGLFPDNAASGNPLRILCLGDVVGKAGRAALKEHLPRLRERLRVHFIIVNGENASGGAGLTPENALELLGAGADVVTGGNHTLRHKELYPLLENDPRLLRPANLPPGAPGKGMGVFKASDKTPVFVLNLMGRVFMDPSDCPFHAADAALTNAEPCIRIVDFHAEATSEKRALAHYLDGRVSAVLGTHTHVQTADAALSFAGTARLTDLGMCGVEDDSILGVAKEPVLKRFVKGLPAPFTPAKGLPSLNGALLELDRENGRTQTVRLLRGKETFLLF